MPNALKHHHKTTDKEGILELISESGSKKRISPFCISDSSGPDCKMCVVDLNFVQCRSAAQLFTKLSCCICLGIRLHGLLAFSLTYHKLLLVIVQIHQFIQGLSFNRSVSFDLLFQPWQNNFSTTSGAEDSSLYTLCFPLVFERLQPS